MQLRLEILDLVRCCLPYFILMMAGALVVRLLSGG
jgi:hypothetical protein